MKKLLLIDGNSLLFRAYFSTAFSGRIMTTSSGVPTNALHGFINMMTKLKKDFDYSHILVAFDTAKKTFRHDLMESYKGGRNETPNELISQIPLIKKYLDLMHIPRYEIETFEADDIIGTLSKVGTASNFDAVDVISGDKDLLQLVNDCVTVHITRKGVTELESYTPAAIFDKYEITADKMTDLKGLMGDASDNLPGIPGIGEKTAIKLLKQFDTLENLIQSTEKLKGKQKENVETYKDQALLCKQMATIKCDMDKVPAIDQLLIQEANVEGLKEFFTEMEFNSFLKTLNVPVKVKKEQQINIITEASQLDQKEFKDCVLHVDVFESNYHRSTIIGFAVANENEAYYVPFDVAIKSSTFASFLATPKINKIIFDAKRAIVALAWQGINIDGVASDPLLKAYVLNPTTADPEFAKVALSYGINDIKYDEQVYGKGAKRHIPELKFIAEHSLSIACALKELDRELTTKLKELNQWELYQEIELPLTKILAEMEYNGMSIDCDVLKDMGHELQTRIDALESQIHELAGSKFNVGSPKQLGVILFETLGLKGKKTKTGSYSTSADILEKLKDAHPIVCLILEYRTLTKLFSTYIEGLQKSIFDDGKVHTIFNQALTQTGRLSSTDPNLQNIPIRLEEGRLIRKSFVASSADHVMIAADYSQIELRILAHVSNTASLIEAFKNNEDVHRKTAAEVFGVALSDVTDDQRRSAKAINFGIVYGQSAFGLSESLQIGVPEAKTYIDGYLSAYDGIKTFMDDTIAEAKNCGFVKTLFERRRYVPDVTSKNFMLRQMAERTAINAPIQGSAADIIKVAMIEVDKLMKKAGVKSQMILQVHDELLFDVPKDEIDVMREIIKTGMEQATTLSVPLKVEMNHGQNWYEAK